jgi:tetratricopeptide (TPR) repeat protein
MVRAAAKKALAVDSLSGAAHGALAKYYAISGDTARERTELALAQRGEPNSPDVIAARGYGYAAVGRTEDALRELERAARLDPRNPLRLTAIAFFQQQAGVLPAAQAAVDLASAIAPTEATLYPWRAWLYLMRDHRDSASAVLHEGIAQAGANSVLFRMAQHTVWVNMIRILRDSLGEPATRLTWKEFGADSIDYYIAKALAYELGSARSRAYFDSIAAWSAPRARQATRASIYKLTRAYGLAGAGRRAEAARELQSFGGAGGSALNSLNLAQLAEAFVMIGDLDRAVGYLDRVLADSVTPFYTPAILQLDPIWKPLRERANFRKLVPQR